MDLPVELVELLKHAGVDGKKLTWDLQVNATAVSVKLIWIKAEKPIATIGEVTSKAPKKKYLSPSTRKRNAQRITKVNTEAKTENSNNQIDETTQSRPSPPQTTHSNTKKKAIYSSVELHVQSQAGN